MKIKLIILAAVIMLCNLSCYKKELSRTVEYSNGAWNESRTEFIFLRWERDFHQPGGISRFPDGGIPKYVRDEKFISVFNKDTGEVKALDKAKGTPRGYPPSVRFSWKGDMVVYKIWSADMKENSSNPVVLIDMNSGETREFLSEGEKPELSPDAKRLATVKDNSVWIMNIDGTGGHIAFEPGEPELIFIIWDKADEMDLYLRDQGRFVVYTLDLNKGGLRRSGKPYLKNYGNESTHDVLKMLNKES